MSDSTLLAVALIPGGLVATLVGHGIEASHTVEAHYVDDGFGDLVEFFTDLVRSWRGWEGHKSWRSLEGELSITARHTGSHVVLETELRHFVAHDSAEWSARLDLTVDAGEELSSAAADVMALLERS